MSAQLTSDMIEAGKELILELDRHKFPAKAAFWLYTEERDRWHLVIATPHLRSMGPLKNYKALHKVMSRIESPIELSSVSIVDTKDRLIKGLSTPFRRPADAAGFRLTHAIISGRVVDDSYIYRVAGRAAK